MRTKKIVLIGAVIVAGLGTGYAGMTVAAMRDPVLQQQHSLMTELLQQVNADPDRIKHHLLDAGRSPRYINLLDDGDLEQLLALADGDADAVAESVAELLQQSPAKLIAVHRELIGKISLDQLNEIEFVIRDLVLDGRLVVEGDSLVYRPASIWPKVLIGGGLAAGVAVAAGGGGGGAAAPAPFVVPQFEVSAAYSADYGHAMIGTEQAHDRGFDGTGVTVAILDTGFMATHVELDGQFDGFYNVFNGSTAVADSADLDGHGTHVAGIIGAKLDGTSVTGVAPGARLVGIRITDGAGVINATDAQLAQGINYAVAQGAAFINNSWATDLPITGINKPSIETLAPLELQAYRDAVAADRVLVFATGNEAPASTQPSVEAGLPHLYPELANHWVAVGAVGPDGTLASYSQPCGVAASWCLVAPGGDDGEGIVSSYNTGGYAVAYGTSMSTPMVTGALAVLKQRFPSLTNDLIVDRLLLTANKTSIYGNSAVYGQGMLDLEKATNPLGPLAVVNPLVSTTGGVQSLALADLQLELSAAFGNSLSRQLSGTPMAVADSQGAGFFIDLGALSRSERRFDLARATARFDTRDLRRERLPLSNRSALQLGLTSNGQQQEINSLLYHYRSAQRQWRFGMTDQLQQVIDQPLADGLQGSHSYNAFLMPYVAATPSLWGSDFSVEHGPIRWGMTALVARPSRLDNASHDPYDIESQLGIFNLRVQAGDALELGVQLGLGTEQQGLLGADFEGAMALSDATPFSYTGVLGVYRLSDATRVSAAAYVGRSRPGTTKGSLIGQISSLTSSSFAVGVDHQIDSRQQLGLVMSQPLRVERGSMTLNLSTGYDGNQFNQVSKQLDLSAPARQLDYELFYQLAQTKSAGVKASLIYQTDPGHQQVSSNTVLLLSAQQQF